MRRKKLSSTTIFLLGVALVSLVVTIDNAMKSEHLPARSGYQVQTTTFTNSSYIGTSSTTTTTLWKIIL